MLPQFSKRGDEPVLKLHTAGPHGFSAALSLANSLVSGDYGKSDMACAGKNAESSAKRFEKF